MQLRKKHCRSKVAMDLARWLDHPNEDSRVAKESKTTMHLCLAEPTLLKDFEFDLVADSNFPVEKKTCWARSS